MGKEGGGALTPSPPPSPPRPARRSPEGPAFGVEIDAADPRRVEELLAAADAYIAASAPAFASLAAALALPVDP